MDYQTVKNALWSFKKRKLQPLMKTFNFKIHHISTTFSVPLTTVLFRQSELGRQTFFTPSMFFPFSLWVNHQENMTAGRPSPMTARSVTGSPRYAASTVTLLESVGRKGMQEGTPMGPWSTEIIRLWEEGCKTESWRVEESVERGLETLMSKQKVTKYKREKTSLRHHKKYFLLLVHSLFSI